MKIYNEVFDVQNDLWRLNDGIFLNDSIINFMLEIFHNEIPKEDLKNSTFVMNSYFFSLALNKDNSDSSLMRILKRRKLST